MSHAGFSLDVGNFLLVDVGVFGAKGDVIWFQCRVGFVAVVIVAGVFVVVFEEEEECQVSFGFE